MGKRKAKAKSAKKAKKKPAKKAKVKPAKKAKRKTARPKRPGGKKGAKKKARTSRPSTPAAPGAPRYVSPSHLEIKCPRCGGPNTEATGTNGPIQRRRCLAPTCRHPFKVGRRRILVGEK